MVSVVVLHGSEMNPYKYEIKNGYKLERHIPQGEGDYHSVTVSDDNFRTEYFNIEQIDYLPKEVDEPDGFPFFKNRGDK